MAGYLPKSFVLPGGAPIKAPRLGGRMHSAASQAARSQDWGSVVGRKGAGITTVVGGDPVMHSMGQYGKTPPKTIV